MTVPFANASLADTLSNRPAPDPNSIGRFFLATDIDQLFRDSGAEWQPCGLNRKTYIALLWQSGMDAPITLPLLNTIGSIAWSYTDSGKYTASLTGAFPQTKTVLTVPNYGTTWGSNTTIKLTRLSDNAVLLEAIDSNVNQDDLLNDTIVEFNVYF